MHNLKTFASIFLLLVISLSGRSQEESSQIEEGGGAALRPSAEQVALPADSVQQSVKGWRAWLTSIDVRVDLAGPAMGALEVTDYYHYEAAVRAGLKNRFFPVFELGYGQSDYKGETTGTSSKCGALYWRLGCDVNLTKPNKHDSRFTLGARYGFSTYTYDISDPSFGDAVWGETPGLMLSKEDGSMHWAELVAGAETRLWRFIHLGWTVRWKFRLKQKCSDIAQPYYAPGYGENGGKTWGATFNLIFEI